VEIHVQSATAENRRGKKKEKEERRRKKKKEETTAVTPVKHNGLPIKSGHEKKERRRKKPQLQNIMACPTGGHMTRCYAVNEVAARHCQKVLLS